MTINLWVMIAAWATFFANTAAAVFVGVQTSKMVESQKETRAQNQHSLCIEIWKNYNEAFSDRQWLLANPISTDEMMIKYGDMHAVFNGDEYKRLRKVASVYGMAASLIRSGAIKPQIIYDYISVPPKLWSDHWPFVKHVRQHFYPSLFVGWEELTTSRHNGWAEWVLSQPVESPHADERVRHEVRP